MQEQLEKLQHKVIEYGSAQTFLKATPEIMDHVEIIICDLYTADGIALKALQKFIPHETTGEVPIIVVTKDASAGAIIEIMKLGVFDHLSAPIEIDELESVINRAIAKPKQQTGSTSLKSENMLIGNSASMRSVEKLIGMAAVSEATVLITGETGTGKDTVARAIHEHSKHNGEPLTVIDCTAVPEDYGSFQSLAEGSRGTIILDEIGDLNSQMQAMLVRALKEIQITPATASGTKSSARVIATTQYNLITMVKEKSFREDLFYRLNVIPIQLPPLRERGSDILVLAETFLQQANPANAKRLSSAASKILLDHEWPGNVRELQNLMYHLNVIVRSTLIEASDLTMLRTTQSTNADDGADNKLDYYSAVATLEKRLLIRALKEANGSRTDAAKLLGINRQLLYSKIKAHGLEDLS